MKKQARKGQIQTGELIMVVIVVMVMVVVGIVFYGGFKTESIKEGQREFSSLDAVDLAQQVMSMPEIICSHIPESDDCVDAHRVSQLIRLIEESGPGSDVFNYYRSKLSSSMIKIEKIYPTYQEWIIYNVSRKNSARQIPLRIPVYVYNATTKDNSFGILTVVSYS